MADSASAISELMINAANGKLNLQQTKDKMRELEAQYGKDVFLDIDYDKAKPKSEWNEEYLQDLMFTAMAGFYSRQFILHLAEVSEYVHSTGRGKKTPMAVLKEKCSFRLSLRRWLWLY